MTWLQVELFEIETLLFFLPFFVTVQSHKAVADVGGLSKTVPVCDDRKHARHLETLAETTFHRTGTLYLQRI